MNNSKRCTMCDTVPDDDFSLRGIKMIEGEAKTYQICKLCAAKTGRINPYDHKLTNERKEFWESVSEKI